MIGDDYAALSLYRLKVFQSLASGTVEDAEEFFGEGSQDRDRQNSHGNESSGDADKCRDYRHEAHAVLRSRDKGAAHADKGGDYGKYRCGDVVGGHDAGADFIGGDLLQAGGDRHDEHGGEEGDQKDAGYQMNSRKRGKIRGNQVEPVLKGFRGGHRRRKRRLHVQEQGEVGHEQGFNDCGKGQKGIDIGMQADVTPEALNVHFNPLNPVIAYRNFKLNEGNYIRLIKGNKVKAMLDLLADDGTGLKLYSTDHNEEAQQDISLSVNRLNLGELSSVMPFMPMIEGFLHGDFHYMQADSTITLSTDMTVKGMKYKGTGMGDIGLNLIYLPNTDGSHYVDGIISQNQREIALLSGKYWEKDKEGQIDATAELSRLPFSLANAFMPPETFKMSGYALGNLEVNGLVSNPILTGIITTDSLHMTAGEYNINLRFPNDTLYINQSHIDLQQIKAYAVGNNPLTLDGDIDFSNLDKIQLNLNMSAKNYQLINARKTRDALAYGKVFVDANSRIWGTLDDLKVRGALTVLGNTDVAYVLKNSPITVEDHLSELVTFCDFTDTVTVEPEVTANQHLDVQMTITIDPTVKVLCLLSDDGRDRIELQGGGNINMTYDLQNELQMYGRYTIDEGTMRYSLMAIPLNDFKIAGGSYVEFVGDIMNPRLNIAASERVKSSVTENGVPKNVTFDVGLKITQMLNNMGLKFTLDAPEDITVQNELSGMSEEERGRIAITMLVTGMYLNDSSDMQGGFDASNTMNAYLQGAINNLAGQALSNSVDLNFGIENNTHQGGEQTTDYSFSFRKRFWGNRVSIIIGGKISTGKNAVNTGQTIIDNVSMEYRLDKNSTRYVRLFYDRNYESLLEGEVTEMGAGLLLRKRAEHLRDLFIFRNKKKEKKK